VAIALLLSACWLTSSLDPLRAPEGDAGGGPGDAADERPPVDTGLDTSEGGDGGGEPPEAGPEGDGGCVVASYVASVLADTPVAYYRLDDTTGTTARDVTKHGYDGTYEGGVTLGVPGVLTDDTAAAFDGTSGIVRVGPNPSFDGKAPFSLEAWIRPAALSAGFRGVVSNETTTTTTNRGGFLMYVEATPDASAGFERWGANVSNPTVAVPSLQVGAWVHLVGTFDGKVIGFYLNGAPVDSYSGAPVSIPQPYTFVIGALFSGAQPTFFDGAIDEVAVYDHALAPRCVLAHYHLGTKQPP
jgi:hypothetical protein